MNHDSEGNILDLSRKTRIVSPALRRALTHRDNGCRFPGCGLKFCDAHHVRHWAQGGETALDNLVLLCRKHHRYLHEEGFRMERGPDGEFRFLRAEVWADLEESGGYPVWDGSRLDLAWAVDGLRSIGTALG